MNNKGFLNFDLPEILTTIITVLIILLVFLLVSTPFLVRKDKLYLKNYNNKNEYKTVFNNKYLGFQYGTISGHCKIKVICEYDNQNLENKLNEFCNGKDIRDIKFSKDTVIVIYRN